MRNDTNRVIEVLAPAKNLKYGIEAINAGADSVYIALEKFGLRRSSHNSIEDIEQLCNYAHKYWAKVYVVLNTAIYSDEELECAQNTINKLYKIGADAIIFSDMGILTLDLPPIPLFAGVHTRCFTPEKAKFLEDIGVKRIILPRELTFDEIKKITEKTTIPIEVFIHSIFCVTYSGNCYFKYGQVLKKTNKEKSLESYQCISANHGNCSAQCGDFYSLLDADGKYIVKNDRLLGLHFLDLGNELENLIDAGVHSFKIEGRQRELSYLKNISAYYNHKVNEVLSRTKSNLRRLSSGTSVVDFEPSLNNIYNRGFTNYFFYGRKKENLSVKDVYGEYIGEIISQSGNCFSIDNTKSVFNVGDRLICKKDDNPVIDIRIIEQNNGVYKFDLENENLLGCKVYRVINAKIVEEIENAKTHRYIFAKLVVQKSDDVYRISMIDEDDVKTTIEYKINPEIKITKEDFIAVFNNKDNDFKISQIDSDDYININKIDMETIKLELQNEQIKARIKARPIDFGLVDKQSKIKYPEKVTCYDNIYNSKAISFYKQHGIENPELGLESTKDIEGKPIHVGKYCIRYELGYCSKLKRTDAPKFPWYLEDKYNFKYLLEFDCAKCEMHILY